MKPNSLQSLVASLTEPRAYPDAVDSVEVKQTHTSVVFLTDTFAYKLKKPVRFGFLDYSTLEKRKYYCEREVSLNRRLAPEIYLGVVSITEGDRGLSVEGSGAVREWAVKMKRIPEEATLESRVRGGSVEHRQIRAVARKLADFHDTARAGDDIARYGAFDAVGRNMIDNFAQTSEHIGQSVTQQVFDRVRTLTRKELSTHRPLIDRRAKNGVPRDTHGDLRLEHVYLLPAGDDPDQIVIVDCIEFNDRFRYADPVADTAFLVMDLKITARRDLANTLADAYFSHRDDAEGRALLSLYTSYRSIVRAKVLGIRSQQDEVAPDERESAARQATAHWLLGLDELETPTRRPCLLLMSGLPGTGKSTVADEIASRANFDVITTDKVRKELQKEAGRSKQAADPYAESSKEAVYQECLHRVTRGLREGRRLIVDGTFHREHRRAIFIERAHQLGVRVLRLICEADPSVVRRRLSDRSDTLSDADWNVYTMLSTEWEPATAHEQPFTRRLDTGRDLSDTVTRVLEFLREAGMY